MISINKLRKRSSISNTNDIDDVYSQYIEDYQFYFDNALNKTKYKDKYNDKIKGECILLDVSNNNERNGDEKWITTLPNSNIQLMSVIALEFAKDLTQYWVVEDKEYLAIPSHDKFKISPLFYSGVLKRYGTNDIQIDTKVVDNDAIIKEKKIYYSPKVVTVERGDYIFYGDSDKTYLVTDVQNFTDLPFADATECNHILKYMISGELYSMLSVVVNNPRFTLGLKTEVAGITEGDDMLRVKIPFTDVTKKINIGHRFIINGQAWKATKTDWTVNKGLITILLGEDSINNEIDDVENEIANRWEITHNYNTTCDNSISVTKGSNYNLVYSFTDNNKLIDSNLITIENSNNLISIIKSNDGKITITGVDIGTGSFKVKLNLTDETREFIVNFDVVSNVIPNKIDYAVTSSNGYTFIKMVGSQISVQKLVNGIADTTLQVDYKVPTNIQALITNGSLSITTKSDNSIYIRNKSVTTLTSFVIEFYDKVTSTKVIDSPTITLKGM